ncbi:restriction endonuclease subunit S [Testudinibacter sp. P80/BLE/0925]
MNTKNNAVPKLRFPDFTDAWEQRKLGDVADIVRGASPRPIQDPKWFDDTSNVGWLRISDVTEQNGRIYQLEQRISKLGQEKTRVLTEPHLLLSIAATVGKPVVNYISTGVHDGFLIFQNPKFEREFMFQWLEMFRSNWQRYGQPGSQINLNSDLVKNQEILLPTIAEQTAIGNFFKQLDEAIASHQRKYERMKKLKQSMLQKMFPRDGEAFPELRFPNFTDAWEQRKLELLASFTKGNGYSKGDLTNKGFPIILYGRLYTKYQSVINEVDTFVSNILSSTIKSSGKEVIVPASGETAEDIARASAVIKQDVILGGDLNIITPLPIINPIFLALVLSYGRQQRDLAKCAQGKSVVHLRNNDLKEVNLIYPTLAEQTAIGNFFKQLDEAIASHQRKLEHMQTLKKGLLQQMFV